MGDGKVKLGRGPYAISIAILSMYAGFQHPGTKYMGYIYQEGYYAKKCLFFKFAQELLKNGEG